MEYIVVSRETRGNLLQLLAGVQTDWAFRERSLRPLGHLLELTDATLLVDFDAEA